LTGSGNNTYLIVSLGEAVLIDAGVGHPDHLSALGRALSDRGASLKTVLLTHGHADHVSGAPAIASAFPAARFAKYRGSGDRSEAGIEFESLSDGQQIQVGDTALGVFHTPGHSPDHVVFWHEATRALFAGDLVIAGSGVTIDLSRGGSLTQYLQSLERVLALEPQRLFPAHGPLVDAAGALLRSSIQHRRERERQVVGAIAAGCRTVEEIAESIYDGLDPRLLPAARDNVRAHLEKLVAEGIVADRGGWRAL
jgi:glyoxylase-like metal-dependent hydrolase (beta-lactamase superfamily II)